MVSGLVGELQGAEVRTTDLLALNERGGNAFLLFLSPRRGDEEGRPRIARPRGHLPARGRPAQPQALGLHVAVPARQAEGDGGLRGGVPQPADHGRARGGAARGRGLGERPHPEDAGRFPDPLPAPGRAARQPDHDRLPAHRGPPARGSPRLRGALAGAGGDAAHSPINLFEAAKTTDLVFELDRHCRRRALRTARDLPVPHLLFVNVVPASMYDPDFQGTSLIKLLEGVGLSPERIVLEVSEGYAIENYTALRGGAPELQADRLLDRGRRHRRRLLGAREDRPPQPALPEVRHAARARHRPQPREAGDGPGPQDLRGQDGLADHRRGHRARGRAAGVRRPRASTSARGTSSARPAPLETFNLGAAAPSSAPV